MLEEKKCPTCGKIIPNNNHFCCYKCYLKAQKEGEKVGEESKTN